MIKSSSRNQVTALIYEDIPRFDLWLKLILGGILALMFIVGLLLLSEDTTGAWVMFGATLFDALLFKAILPQRFQIFQDRLRIVLGGPFAVNISLSNIKEVRAAPSMAAFAYGGIRFVTSAKGVVEIVRKKGWSLVISPANADMFIEQMNRALAEASNLG
jgi:hypothetical protein